MLARAFPIQNTAIVAIAFEVLHAFYGNFFPLVSKFVPFGSLSPLYFMSFFLALVH